jgi:ABC-2 type transport system permease protein
MRCAFLVAWREYTENARTKGFWIGIFLLPVIVMRDA